MSFQILQGDCIEQLKQLDDGIVQTCVTSPPYWGLRDYGAEGQLGLEPTPEEYVANMVEVFREVKRVLRDDGTVWLNLGDSYANTKAGNTNEAPDKKPRPYFESGTHKMVFKKTIPAGLKPKDLVGIPWLVAFALRADGWYLRSDIIWHKLNPMPESVTDRPTKSHEYIFLLSKSQKYFYDAEAIKEDSVDSESINGRRKRNPYKGCGEKGFEVRGGFSEIEDGKTYPTRNKRSVWTVSTQPYPGAHFATFPPKLIEPCILAGSKQGDTVLDPFAGSGTTLWVSEQNGRDSIGIELNPEYIELINKRMDNMQMNLFMTGVI